MRVLALVRVLASELLVPVALVPRAELLRLRARLRVRHGLPVRHVAADVSSIPRPRKAR